jgi:hypothetical protein
MSTLIRKTLEKNGLQPSAAAPGSDGNEGNQGNEGDQGNEGAGGSNQGDEGAGGANNSTDNNDNNSNSDDTADKGAAGSGGSQSQEPTEEQVLAVLNKRRGTNFTSLEDAFKPTENQPGPTEEQQRQSERDRQNNIRAWALQEKKVTSTDFDEFARESSVPYVELAYDLYKADRITALRASGIKDADLPDDKELENEFNDLNFQFAKPDDPKRIKAEKRLKNEVDEHLATKYSKIYDLEHQYGNHETVITRRTEYNSTISKVFDEAATDFQELSFDVAGDKKGEKIPYKFKVTPELLNSIRTQYGTEESFALLGQGKIDPAALKGAIKNNLITAALNEIVSEVANAHAKVAVEAIKKGRRNIPDRTDSSSEGSTVVTNPVIKRMIEKNKKLLEQ